MKFNHFYFVIDYIRYYYCYCKFTMKTSDKRKVQQAVLIRHFCVWCMCVCAVKGEGDFTIYEYI